MVDVLLLVATVIVALILLSISFYVLAIYVHSTPISNEADDKGWGTALYCKVLVILSMSLCWTQALMVPLDVANSELASSSQINMGIFWQVNYFMTLGMLTILLPYAIFFYDTAP